MSPRSSAGCVDAEPRGLNSFATARCNPFTGKSLRPIA